ncbi:MAG: glycosyltransferase family 2 protein [Planctomycetota bacterium]|jgi:glycosyltransferase involved in cell wall biosynthesis
MNVSIIVSVLNSHEIVRRQILHYEKMDMPDDVEILFMDDGSDPPLTSDTKLKNFHIHATNDFRPWSVGVARNTGAKLARGEYYLMSDIDYVISREAIEAVRHFTGQKMRFRRQFGVLDPDGNFTQDFETLKEYGLLPERIEKKGAHLPPHPNNFAIRKDIFWMLGGYDEKKMDLPYPKCTDDSGFKRRWAKARERGEVVESDRRPTLYMFPTGQFCGDVDYNPFGLFHELSRKNEANYYWGKQCESA